MGYNAPVDSTDVSNSNTPAVIDPTNPVGTAFYRAVARLDRAGHLDYTETNAYSGNNGRAAVFNTADGVYYTAGNAGNGGAPQPSGVIAGAGAQIIAATHAPESAQLPGAPTPVGSFNISQLGDTPDKIGKDTNFRGLTVYDNVVYLTKGSGGNGVNTVYFIDTTGTACPNGTGLPVPGAPLPTAPISYDPATVQTTGLSNNMCVLHGFPTALKSTTSFPFGIWFANPTTLYVADEGNADTAYDASTNRFTAAAAQTQAGLQKWVLDQRRVDARLHHPERARARHALRSARLPHGRQQRHRPALVAGNRWPAQYQRPRQSRRHRQHLGDHLHRVRRHRYRCRPEPSGQRDRSSLRHHPVQRPRARHIHDDPDRTLA